MSILKIHAREIFHSRGNPTVEVGPEVILPVPAFNVINGGSHAGHKLAMQEFTILPVGRRPCTEAYHNPENLIKDKYGKDATNMGEEGGLAPNIMENKEALQLLKNAIGKAGYKDKVVIGMDVAASEFFLSVGSRTPPGTSCPTSWPTSTSPSSGHPGVSIEDPLDQDYWQAWQKFTAGTGIQVVGDDLTVTNPKRIAKAMSEKACNCLLLVVNKIGLVTESLQACKLAQSSG
ncbi:Alpha-enolase [Heterocephalus glaber]|uniref:phosphopyruvate hydratase n=1 Tax=Heterocephalus glaber TaxID=10181 RepID=G5BB18_HETGA|nr:Alpha-enolase [Heterocephalus glaber]